MTRWARLGRERSSPSPSAAPMKYQSTPSKERSRDSLSLRGRARCTSIWSLPSERSDSNETTRKRISFVVTQSAPCLNPGRAGIAHLNCRAWAGSARHARFIGSAPRKLPRAGVLTGSRESALGPAIACLSLGGANDSWRQHDHEPNTNSRRSNLTKIWRRLKTGSALFLCSGHRLKKRWRTSLCSTCLRSAW